MNERNSGKKRRKLLRQLAATAHRRELEQALSALEAQFRAWREGTIDAFQLSEGIHEFHNGLNRELWKRYVSCDPEMSVPFAIAQGVLKEGDVPSEVFEQMRLVVQAFRGGSGQQPGE